MKKMVLTEDTSDQPKWRTGVQTIKNFHEVNPVTFSGNTGL